MILKGQEFKDLLNLSRFKYVWVQKVISNPQPIYIITIDSRYPNNYLSFSRVKKAKFTSLISFINGGEGVKDIKLTPPLEINDFSMSSGSNNAIFIRDLAGEYLIDKKMYGSLKKKNINLEVLC